MGAPAGGVGLDGVPVAVVAVDAELRVVASSAAFDDLVGRPVVPGSPLRAVIPEKASTVIEDHVREALAGAAPSRFDATFRQGAARRTWDVTVGRAVGIQEGAAGEGVVIGVTDVTRERAAAWRAQTLRAVAVDLAGAVDRTLVMSSISRGARALGASSAAFGVIVAEGTGVRVETILGADDTAAERVLPLDADLPVPLVARTGSPLAVERGADVGRRFTLLDGSREGALAVAPLRVGDRTIGALSIRWPRDGEVSPETTDYLDALARLAAQAVDRVELLDRERLSRFRAEALARIAAALAGRLTEADVERVLLEELASAVGAVRAWILRRHDDGSLEHADSFGYEPEAYARFKGAVPTSATLAARAIGEGRPVRLRLDQPSRSDGLEELRAQLAPIADEVVSVPLLAHGVPLGGVSLALPRDTRADAEVLSFLRAAADIGGQAVERARLRSGEERLRRTLEAVLAQMPVGVVVADRSGEVLVENAMARRLLAGVVAPVESETEAGSKGPRRRRAAAPGLPLDRALRNGETVEGAEVAVDGEDGGRVTLLVSAAPVFAEDGGRVGAVEVISDISARKEHELARETFIGVLSHELRTPITTIFGNATLLTDRPGLSASTRDDLVEGIAAEAARLHEMVEDLLVLARVERGIDLAAGEPVLLTHLVRGLVAAEQRNHPEIAYTLDVPRELPLVAGDDGYIDQILRNLLSNAAKYGRGAIAVTVGDRPEGVVLEVADDGPGVPPEDLPRLFELFYRGRRSLHNRTPGAGIGLYVCRKLAAAMGARIDARSGSAGSTFTVVFTRLDEQS
jgi:signal transduction histidine kinase